MSDKINYLSHEFYKMERARAEKLKHIGEEILYNSKQVKVDERTIRLDRMTDEEIIARNKKNGK